MGQMCLEGKYPVTRSEAYVVAQRSLIRLTDSSLIYTRWTDGQADGRTQMRRVSSGDRPSCFRQKNIFRTRSALYTCSIRQRNSALQAPPPTPLLNGLV